MIADSKDKSVFRLKFSLALASFLMLIVVVVSCSPYFGSEIPFVSAVLAAVLMAKLVLSEIYRNYRVLKDRHTVIIYKHFNLVMTVPFVVVYGLAAIMLFIFYPGAGAIFFGLTNIVLAIHLALNFLIFDFSNNSVSGLFGNGKSPIDQLHIEVLPGKEQIRFNSPSQHKSVVLVKDKVSDVTWNSLINNFRAR